MATAVATQPTKKQRREAQQDQGAAAPEPPPPRIIPCAHHLLQVPAGLPGHPSAGAVHACRIAALVRGRHTRSGNRGLHGARCSLQQSALSRLQAHMAAAAGSAPPTPKLLVPTHMPTPQPLAHAAPTPARRTQLRRAAAPPSPPCLPAGPPSSGPMWACHRVPCRHRRARRACSCRHASRCAGGWAPPGGAGGRLPRQLTAAHPHLRLR